MLDIDDDDDDAIVPLPPINSPAIILPSLTQLSSASSTILTIHGNAATSNDPWGPTGTEMAEIAALTFGR